MRYDSIILSNKKAAYLCDNAAFLLLQDGIQSDHDSLDFIGYPV